MSKIKLIATALLVAWTIRPTVSHAREISHSPAPEQHQTAAKGTDPASCRIPIYTAEEAERQPGGGLFQGPRGGHDMMEQGRAMPEMSEMEGAHIIHRPQHGGTFFMAPNKMNQLEALYSDSCGFRVIFYNIRTEYIRADRFQAIVKVVSDSMYEPVVIRFLFPDQGGEVLSAAIDDNISPPFKIELYVKFPESADPVLFSMSVL